MKGTSHWVSVTFEQLKKKKKKQIIVLLVSLKKRFSFWIQKTKKLNLLMTKRKKVY